VKEWLKSKIFLSCLGINAHTDRPFESGRHCARYFGNDKHISGRSFRSSQCMRKKSKMRQSAHLFLSCSETQCGLIVAGATLHCGKSNKDASIYINFCACLFMRDSSTILKSERRHQSFLTFVSLLAKDTRTHPGDHLDGHVSQWLTLISPPPSYRHFTSLRVCYPLRSTTM
jgi:hypothetical protein